jgi:superfamily II DNA/RNA helicase
VVQWKLPASTSTFVQRAGRAGRRSGSTGLAVLLVEQSAYTVQVEKDVASEVAAGKPAKGGKGAKKNSKTELKGKQRKEFAEARGSRRGDASGQHDTIILKEQPPIDEDAMDEGLFVLVQTGICRRKVLTEVFGNKTPG